MRIALATMQFPFVYGGAEGLVTEFSKALRTHGHDVEVLRIPSNAMTPDMVENELMVCRLLDMNVTWGGSIDLCIGLKSPAYFLPHSNKILWMLHQYRQAYETPDLRGHNEDKWKRAFRLMREADARYLPEAKKIYTISKIVSGRLKKNCNIDSTPVYHPCPEMDTFYHEAYGDYILVPSRINKTKRQLMLLQAMEFAGPNVKLVFLGKGENDDYAALVHDYAKHLVAEGRVKFLGFVSKEEKLRLYANARAVAFIPFQEDYGYITLEAMSARKPVLTTWDSGGPTEFIVDGENGWVSYPTPEALGEALNRLMDSDGKIRDMGEAAYAHLQDMNITWDATIEELIK